MLDKLIKYEFNLIAIKEHRFDPTRRWRFDYCILDKMIAIEIEGGIYSNGRHTRGSGFEKDMEKYNTATSQGWRLIRVKTGDYSSALKFIKMILENDCKIKLD